MLGGQLGILAAHAMQQLAQLRGVAGAPGMERIEDRPVASAPDAHQEVAGEVQPGGVLAHGARDMDVDDAQRHRQALAPLEHAREIGVLQIVVGRGIASETEILRHRAGQRLVHRGAAGAGARVVDQQRQQAVIGVEIGQLATRGAEQKRRFGHGDARLLGAQMAQALVDAVRTVAFAHGCILTRSSAHGSQ